MLKVKHLIPFKPKIEKAGIFFYQGCKKSQALLDLFCNLVSRLAWF